MSGHFTPNEINARATRPIAQPLIKAVLSFIAVGTPDEHARTSFEALAVDAVALAERFHLQLLQPRHKYTQTFVIRQQAVCRDLQYC